MGSENILPRSISAASIVPSSQDRTPIGRDFSVSFFYENGLPFSVKVVLRNGFAVVLPPHGNAGLNNALTNRIYDLVVRVKYSYSRGVKIDANNILDGISEELDRELFAMALAAKQSNAHYMGSVEDFSIDYRITREQFENEQCRIYIPEVDVTVVKSDDIKTVHPRSPEGQAILANESGDLLGYLYRIEIVDPYDQFGHRFVNIAGKVDRVIPVKDLQRKPGVYVHRVMRSDISKSADIEPQYFEFEEAIKFVKLFRTEDEAKALGDLSEERKREYEEKIANNKLQLAELEHKLKDESTKAKAIQADIDSRNAEITQLRELLKTAREERMLKLKEETEKRSQQRNDYYEQRSYSRKDDSEMLKWIPAIILGGGLLAYKLFWD